MHITVRTNSVEFLETNKCLWYKLDFTYCLCHHSIGISKYKLQTLSVTHIVSHVRSDGVENEVRGETKPDGHHQGHNVAQSGS